MDSDSVLEVKCRGCGRICAFLGEDREIVSQRAVLIKKGLIPDTDAEPMTDPVARFA